MANHWNQTNLGGCATLSLTRRVYAGLFAVSTLSLGAALFAQYALDMRPCPWCILQRIILMAIGLCSLVLYTLPDHKQAGLCGRVGSVGVGSLALGGVASALYQHFYAAASTSCAQSFADKVITGLRLDTLLPSVFEPQVACAQAAASVLGVPFEFLSATLFLGIGGSVAWRSYQARTNALRLT